MLVGDSLQGQMADSLLFLLHAKGLKQAGGGRRVINCPDIWNFNITVVFRRNNFVLDTPIKRCDASPAALAAVIPAMGDRNTSSPCTRPADVYPRDIYNPNNYDIQAQPWYSGFLDSPHSTLLILAASAHDHTVKEARPHLDTVLRLIQDRPRSGDLVVVRTLPQDHSGCSEFSVPLRNASENSALHGSAHEFWHGFPQINLYVQDAARNANARNSSANVAVLDVVPMTELRPDGHARPGKDCLHYRLPGPIDYWNHLLFNGLHHLALTCSAKYEKKAVEQHRDTAIPLAT